MGSRLVSLLVCLLAVAICGACDTVRLTAPTGSEVTVFSNTTVVPLGGTAEIFANVIESGGTPVHDGTVVQFTTTIGTLDPSEGTTDDGRVRTVLRVGNQSGTAFIRAFSGGALSEDLELIVGAAAVAQVLLTANPSSISANTGGTVTLTAVVVDEGNSPVPNVSVNFTTSSGSLGTTSATTNANGQATTTLNTNRETTVQALVGAIESNEVTITANLGPRVTVTPTPPTVNEGSTVTFAVSVTPDTNVPLRDVEIEFGDGASQSLGTGQTSSVSHVYRNDGVYTVTVTAQDANGERGSGTTTVVVTPAPGLNANVTAQPNPVRVNNPVTFAVSLTNTTLTPLIESITYDFGDNNTRTSGTPTTYIYNRVGNFRVTATVTLTDGRSDTTEVDVVVQP